MPQHPISAPDPVPPSGLPSNTIRAQGDDASFETDFAELAARFAAQSGGGLSPELSADLALEIVLNEIVEQACLTTGATGAAIVLRRDGEMVCRASSGATAPDLGARVDTSSGLAAECVRTQTTQRCDDALIDMRADVEASARLGIRSVMVMPLIRGGALVGFFELFSTRANAFGEREERAVEGLASRALGNLARAAEPLEAHRQPIPAAEPWGQIARERIEEPSQGDELRAQRKSEVTTWLLGAAVLVCAILLGIALAPHLGLARRVARLRPAPAAAVKQDAQVAHVASVPDNENPTQVEPQQPRVLKAERHASIRPGGLLVTQNGKEVFRAEPAGIREVEETASIDTEQTIHLSANEAEDSVTYRVEPTYPDAALRGHVQGAVVLDVQIGSDGRVQGVQVVSGPPLLAQASTDAVRQWRFKTRRVNGRTAEMQTRVILNFRLP